MPYYTFYSCLRSILLGYRLKAFLEKVFSTVFGLLIVLVLPGMQASHAQTQSAPGQRIALLIGNAAYKGDFNSSTQDWNKLQNAAKDAQDVGNALKKLGFRPDDVEVLQNKGLREMKLAIARFSKRAETADQVVFYYSGHGVQHKTLNYLIPVDAPARDSELHTLSVDTVTLQEVVNAVSVGPGQKVVMIDACRTEPGAKGDAGGLANPEAQRPLPPQTVVVFAAAAGQRALDGRGQSNGYFAQGLLAGLRDRDTTLRNVIDVAEEEVLRLSGGSQQVTPYGGSLAQKRFSFAPVKPTQGAVAPIAAPIPPPAPAAPQPGIETPAYPGGPIMVTLPRGSYLRGSQDEDGRRNNEGPVKTVTIAYNLQMGKTEVTRGEFAQFVNAKKYKTEAESSGQGCSRWDGKTWTYDKSRNWTSPGFNQTDNHPVVCISWNDAQAYIAWVNEKAGLASNATNRFRLPSEAEFEYATRGVTSPTQNRSGAQHTRFYWGNDAGYKQMCGYANGFDLTAKTQYPGYSAADCPDKFVNTAPVASFGNTAQTRHPFGLHDMLGNAGEWVQDCYEDNYNSAPDDGKAYVPLLDIWCQRVLRGGGWINSPQNLGSAFRDRSSPGFRDVKSGLRLARTVF